MKFSKPEELEPLRAFDDGVYLHQVVERGGERLRRYLDLPEALRRRAEVRSASAERTYRVHFHVPVFRERSVLSRAPNPTCATCWKS